MIATPPTSPTTVNRNVSKIECWYSIWFRCNFARIHLCEVGEARGGSRRAPAILFAFPIVSEYFATAGVRVKFPTQYYSKGNKMGRCIIFHLVDGRSKIDDVDLMEARDENFTRTIISRNSTEYATDEVGGQ